MGLGETVLGKGVRWWRDMQDPRDHLPSGGETRERHGSLCLSVGLCSPPVPGQPHAPHFSPRVALPLPSPWRQLSDIYLFL